MSGARPRFQVVTPDLRAALREAFVESCESEFEHVLDFDRFVDALADNLRRMDACGMDWRGRS